MEHRTAEFLRWAVLVMMLLGLIFFLVWGIENSRDTRSQAYEKPVESSKENASWMESTTGWIKEMSLLDKIITLLFAAIVVILLIFPWYYLRRQLRR